MERRGTVSHVSFCGPVSYQIDVKGCFVRTGFKTEQITSEYLWVWMAALLMTILYIVMFIVMREWVIVDEDGVWHWHKNYRLRHPLGALGAVEETQDEKDSKATANLLL